MGVVVTKGNTPSDGEIDAGKGMRRSKVGIIDIGTSYRRVISEIDENTIFWGTPDFAYFYHTLRPK